MGGVRGMKEGGALSSKRVGYLRYLLVPYNWTGGHSNDSNAGGSLPLSALSTYIVHTYINLVSQ